MSAMTRTNSIKVNAFRESVDGTRFIRCKANYFAQHL